MKEVSRSIKARIFHVAIAIVLVLPLLVVSQPARAAPLISLTPASGAAGTAVTVTGTNFESYRGDNLYVFFGNDEVSGSPFTVPQEGTFKFLFTVPGGISPGGHIIRIRSEAGSTLAQETFTVSEVGIRLDSVIGSVGSVVTVTGKGFYANQTVTFHYFNRGEQKIGSEVASDTGAFSFQFTIPEGVAGKHIIRAENIQGDIAEAEFEVVPSILPSITQGPPGEKLTITGTGFAYKSGVHIFFRTTEVAYANTDQYGSFRVELHVPDISAGTYDIRALDSADNMDETRFTITAGASLNKNMGAVGSELVITGTGFTPGGRVVVDYDNTEVLAVTANNAGEFTGSFYVPLSKGGKHIITVSDGTNTRRLDFTVETSPPPVPDLLLPKNNPRTSATAYLDWGDVTDSSRPVIYRLQLASDLNFARMALEKNILTVSEYTLSAKEALEADKPDTYYYWRVRAVDGASNESEWSPPRSFIVSPPSTVKLLLPEPASKQEARTHFDWEDSSSMSPPITYTLQVAGGPEFNKIVLEKTGIEASEYTLTDEERLAAVKEDVPYYWRVKAVDAAGNESDWSETLSFHVGISFKFPLWATVFLVLIGVILLGWFAFWLGRRTGYGARPT